MSDNSRIAIIGAGVSGLTAAVRLARAGHKNITLFEARREAGGRTRSYIDPHTGDTLDNGQHLLMGCYTATLEFLKMIGTEKLIERTPLRIPFWSETGVRSFTIDRSLPPPMNLLSAVARTSMLTFGEKKSASVFGNAIWRMKLPNKFERMSCADLFLALGQSPSLVEKLWAPMVLATINAQPEQASAELFVNVLREAFFSSRAASALLIPKCGLSELLVDSAIRDLRDKRDGKCETRMGTPVRRIESWENGFRIVTDNDEASFDAIISSIESPIPGLPKPDTRNPIPAPHSPIVNAYFWFDKSIFNAPVHAFIGTTLQWAFPKKSGFSAERVALTVSAADALSEKTNEEIRDILLGDLQKTVPAARGAKLIHDQIIREKRATPLFTPEANRRRPATTTDIPNFFLAGDIVQNGLPATIEGAVRNGFAAADALLNAVR